MSWTSSFPWANVLADFYTKTAIPDAPKHTGRLPLSDQETRLSIPPAVLFAPEPGMESSVIKERIHFRHGATSLNEEFFSQANVDRLQEQIRATVRQMVNADIDRQNDVDLKLVMRSYYLQYAENNPQDTVEELQLLNERVVNFCANRIAVEVEAYRYYRKDILDFPAPIAHPLQTNVYGTRTGELKRFF
jgi:hypothetical protein